MKWMPHRSYKESGASWIGNIPEHWSVERMDRKAITHRVTVSPDALSYRQVIHYSIPNIQQLGGATEEDGGSIDSNKLVINREQLLVSKLNPHKQVVVRAAPHSDLLTIASSEFVPLVPRSGDATELRFLSYLWSSSAAMNLLLSNADSATRSHQRVAPEVITKATFGWPPHPEQRQIVLFLDHETAKLDTLIAKQDRLIELLQEKKQAVISHAATKGLDPKAPMKESGVEWLGTVPAHWDVRRLKWISPHITVGIVVEPSKYYVDDGVPALRSLNVRPGALVGEDLVYISAGANELLAKSRLRSGDLVAVRSGQPGTTAVVPDEFDGCNCIDLIIVRRSEAASSDFLCWYLNSDTALRQFAEGSGGAIQQHFNIGTATNLIVPVPPLPEQKAIDTQLKLQTARIEALILKARQSIDLMREHRSALISAAVTGKIDVMEAA